MTIDEVMNNLELQMEQAQIILGKIKTDNIALKEYKEIIDAYDERAISLVYQLKQETDKYGFLYKEHTKAKDEIKALKNAWDMSSEVVSTQSEKIVELEKVIEVQYESMREQLADIHRLNRHIQLRDAEIEARLSPRMAALQKITADYQTKKIGADVSILRIINALRGV